MIENEYDLFKQIGELKVETERSVVEDLSLILGISRMEALDLIEGVEKYEKVNGLIPERSKINSLLTDYALLKDGDPKKQEAADGLRMLAEVIKRRIGS